MKNKLIALTLFTLATVGVSVPTQEAKSDFVGWRCNLQTYCNTNGFCWQRKQCYWR